MICNCRCHYYAFSHIDQTKPSHTVPMWDERASVTKMNKASLFLIQYLQNMAEKIAKVFMCEICVIPKWKYISSLVSAYRKQKPTDRDRQSLSVKMQKRKKEISLISDN